MNTAKEWERSDSPQPAVSLPEELEALTSLVEQKPQSLVAGDVEMQAAALDATKFLFDRAVQSEAVAVSHINALLASILPESGPQTRSSTKRKRSPSPPPPPKPKFPPTPIESLYLPGMQAEQIWEQLELRTKSICQMLDSVIEREGEDDEEHSIAGVKEMQQDEESEDTNESDVSVGEDDETGSADSMDQDDIELEEHVATLVEEESSEEEEEEEERADLGGLDLDRPKRTTRLSQNRPRHPTLDDAFFSIDEFNRLTEELEANNRSRGGLASDEDEEDEEEVGVDLFAPVEEVEDAPVDEEMSEDESDVNDPYFQDFFAPPPKFKKGAIKGQESEAPIASPKKRSVRFNENVRVKKIKAVGKSRPYALDPDEEDDDEEDEYNGLSVELDGDEDSYGVGLDSDQSEGDDESNGDGLEDGSLAGEEAIERIKDDLFAEDEDETGESQLSTHEQRLAELSKQIASLEAENVGDKDWTMIGEANARSRPQNSLLEEDLEFEHAAKQVPIITEEVTKSLEDRIKARILENRFDDVVRKRAVDDKPFLPSRIIELQDTKSSKSLAQIYEDEYTSARFGDKTIDDRDGKLAAEHEAIEGIWSEICYKLDSLCNAHFTPKQPKATISSISNLASITLESALPTATSTSTLMAPEEVYSYDKTTTHSKTELTPSEKKTAHNRQKKLKKKQRQALDHAVDKFTKKAGGRKQPKNVKDAKDMALKSLVKSGRGVTVVGKPQVAKELGVKKRFGQGKESSERGNGKGLKV